MDLPWSKSKGKGVAADRVRSADPYHTNRWTRLSRAFRATHPLCEMCKANGIVKPATCVDHIVPWPICQDDFYNRSNLQALCEDCNHEKGQRDKKRIQEWKRQHGG
jgi:5-methylcytosine-specific restriction endonuclease McrA